MTKAALANDVADIVSVHDGPVDRNGDGVDVVAYARFHCDGIGREG